MKTPERFAGVILAINNKNVDKTFDYLIPKNMEEVSLGSRVLAPFGTGNRPTEGYVVELKRHTDCPPEKLKSLISVEGAYPVYSESMIRLAHFMRDKYYTTLASCFRCIMPSGAQIAPVRQDYIYLTGKGAEGLKSKKQQSILDFMEESGALPVSTVMRALSVSRSPIDSLIKSGYLSLEPVEVPRMPFDSADYEYFEPHELLPEQHEALGGLLDMLCPDYSGARVALLHGVTGSGKTEVYMRLIDEVVKSGKQAIMLVPEISLTPQTVKNFVGRFAEKVSVTHSRLSAGERIDQWRRARDGKISVMIGPRSAIFTPFDRLGAIIIDEEHESTYKSETTPKYCVKELSEELSRLTGCVVVLGSATPSVETYHKAVNGRIKLIEIRERINKNPPKSEIIDMRIELAKGNKTVFGEKLRNAMSENLENKELTILFLNRRGHSTFVSCRACGHVLSCGECSINYTYHIATNRLCCHYCGAESLVPANCPVCGSPYIKYFGAGTQKVEEEIHRSFPKARVLRMDMDTTSRKNSHEKIYRSFLNGEADILIGTQMIAKGLDFPRVTLVGVIAADISIHMGDFRSAEKAFQLITQVSGRAGRAQYHGRVFIQSYNPEHYSIIYAKNGDYKSFYEHEITIRRQMAYPPFSHIFCVLLSGENEKNVVSALIKLSRIMAGRNTERLFEPLSPTPAMVSKIKNVYRHKIIVKGFDEEGLKDFVFSSVDELAKTGELTGITVNATLDPLNIP